jgi:hypothetical protein
MMSAAIWWHALAGFAAGGAYIALCSNIASRGNSTLAGVLTGMPSTVLIALLVMALSVSPAAAVNETTSAPAALAFNGIFLGVFARTARFGWILALGAGLAVWFLLVAAWWVWAPRDLSTSLALGVAGFLLGMAMTRGIGSVETLPASPGTRGFALLARAMFGGAVIAATVLVYYLGGPFAGGLAAAFPATAAATLAIVAWTCGGAPAAAMVRHIIIANFLTITPYLLVVRATYDTVGVAAGTLLGLVLSAFIAWILYSVSRRCQRSAS